MKSNYKRIIIIVAIALVLVLAWFLFIRKKEEPIALQTQKPAKGYIAQSVTATGRIEPVDTVTVGTQVSGIIKYLYADFNSKVKKGQLIAELDKSLLQATVDQFKGNLQNAQSQLAFAKKNFDRQSLLFKTDAISKADYDSALNTYDAARATVSSAQAQVRSAQKNLSYAQIYSPIDGVVLNRNISTGQTVAASFSTPTLFVIAKDITKMEVEANVDEADIGDVKTGDRSSFTVDAFINDQFGGTVRDVRLHPSVSANVVTYTTIINAPNDDMKLKPGMTANIIIYTKEVNNALLIPAKALSFTPDSSMMKDYEIVGKIEHKGKRRKAEGTGGGAGAAGGGTTGAAAPGHTVKSRKDSTGTARQFASVWVLQGKKIVRKRIQTGINDNTQVEILSGLSPDDLVVTGMTGGAAGATAAAKPGASPFMPARRGGGGGGGPQVMDKKKILEITELKREFQMGSETVRALKGISFDVKAGEFVTIMGSSGSGKTTLLNILGCLDKPSIGDYFLDGVDVKKLSRDELAQLRNRKIGFVFQAYNLLPRTTALENVELPLLYNKEISVSERHERAMAALTAVKLGDRFDHTPNQLSGGQQQRVAIARALVNEPVMILADEATGNLDSRTSYEIMALMQDLNTQQGKTIVFVTHEPDIAAFSSRTIQLRDGRIQKDTNNAHPRSAREMLAGPKQTIINQLR